jgi:CubicO group peptidase (beta-lactamase class C family)
VVGSGPDLGDGQDVAQLRTVVRRVATPLAVRHAAVVVAAVRDDVAVVHGVGRALFDIGPVTEAFTGLLLARFVVAGDVELDQDVATLLPDGARSPAPAGRPITLRQLATHTSGLPALGGPSRTPFRRLPPPTAAPGAVLADLHRVRLMGPPGARYARSELGTGLLGMLLGLRAGVGADRSGFDALLQDRVCTPLGLTDTGAELGPDRAPRATPGHTADGRRVTPSSRPALAAASGLRSTADDLVRFVRAQLQPPDGDLGDAVRLCQEAQRVADDGTQLCLGWRGRPAEGTVPRILFQEGGTAGFSAWLGVAPERQAGVLVLSASALPVDENARALLHRVAGAAEE